jgi:chitodextrinase
MSEEIMSAGAILLRDYWRRGLALALCLLLGGCALGTPQPTARTSAVPTGSSVTPAPSSGQSCAPLQAEIAGFPPTLEVDCDYIYTQLVRLATTYQQREAGQGEAKPGHAGFANAWTAEMLTLLASFGPTVIQDPFAIQGYKGRPAKVPAMNVEITLAGVVHPEQEVVIGCHYDGFANSSQSAYDDASGCAIMLGLAKALATHWHATETAPARTLKFVLFDAEEQGLLGSFHYLNQTIAGDRSQVVAMFDEEQNGVDYPARAFGRANQPFLPFITLTSPVNPTDFYQPTLGNGAHRAQFQAWQTFSTQAISNAFMLLRAMHPTLTYLPGSTQQVFTPTQLADRNTIQIADDTLGGSDEVPFTLAGINCITMSGNFSYYDGPGAPAWSYPFDQPEDTVALMNQYTGGSGAKSEGTVLSLALPAMVTLWMLIQPDVMGLVAAPTGPVGTISDLPNDIQPGAALTLSALGAYSSAGDALSYQWNFGNGATASGNVVQHAWASTGSYTLQLTIQDSAGKQIVVQKTVAVGQQFPLLHNRFDDFPPSNGFEPPDPYVPVPTPAPGTP